MSTVPDHPVALIKSQAEDAARVSRDFGRGLSHAASLLTDHERTRGVVFAALDLDALAAVREEYERWQRDAEATNVSGLNANGLADAISALLGLDAQ